MLDENWAYNLQIVKAFRQRFQILFAGNRQNEHHIYREKTRRWPNVGLMLAHRRRRWANI